MRRLRTACRLPARRWHRGRSSTGVVMVPPCWRFSRTSTSMDPSTSAPRPRPSRPRPKPPEGQLLSVGEVIAGRFEIAALADWGSMGAVYHALDRETSKRRRSASCSTPRAPSASAARRACWPICATPPSRRVHRARPHRARGPVSGDGVARGQGPARSPRPGGRRCAPRCATSRSPSCARRPRRSPWRTAAASSTATPTRGTCSSWADDIRAGVVEGARLRHRHAPCRPRSA